MIDLLVRGHTLRLLPTESQSITLLNVPLIECKHHRHCHGDILTLGSRACVIVYATRTTTKSGGGISLAERAARLDSTPFSRMRSWMDDGGGSPLVILYLGQTLISADKLE